MASSAICEKFLIAWLIWINHYIYVQEIDLYCSKYCESYPFWHNFRIDLTPTSLWVGLGSGLALGLGLGCEVYSKVTPPFLPGAILSHKGVSWSPSSGDSALIRSHFQGFQPNNSWIWALYVKVSELNCDVIKQNESELNRYILYFIHCFSYVHCSNISGITSPIVMGFSAK